MTVRCPHCGVAAPASERFCGNCGQALPDPTATQPLTPGQAPALAPFVSPTPPPPTPAARGATPPSPPPTANTPTTNGECPHGEKPTPTAVE